MDTLDTSPFYRSTVGFDRLFDLVEKTARSDWPPYDIEKTGDNTYRITMAIAGFTPDEVEVTQHGINLLVSGRKGDQPDREFLHQGIAGRKFQRTFNLTDHVKVASADLKDGLLSIDLVREVPEALRPRKIDIGASRTSSDNLSLVNDDTGRDAA